MVLRGGRVVKDDVVLRGDVMACCCFSDIVTTVKILKRKYDRNLMKILIAQLLHSYINSQLNFYSAL